MARIIPLKRDMEPLGDAATSLQGCAGEPAEIILFPGVRYERWHEDHEATRPHRHIALDDQRIARDWLDI